MKEIQLPRHGLDKRTQKHLAYFMSKFRSPKKGVLQHTKIVEICAHGVRLTLKLVRLAVRENQLHSQGLDGHPQKKFASWTSEFELPKKWCAIT